MTPRPADEARRALREARERAAQEPDASPTDRPAPSPPRAATGQETPRPGDVAREALRRSVSEHRGTGRDDEDPAGDAVTVEAADEDKAGTAEPDASGGQRVSEAGAPADEPEDAPAAGRVEPDGPGDPQGSAAAPREGARSGSRAADIAREALRASRDDARRAREETENEGARRRRRGARQRAVDERAAAARRAGEPDTRGGAQDVAQLTADMFRMPTAELPETPAPTRSRPTPATPEIPRTPETPGAPRPPRSMAAPDRDSELRRTFPPFPPREGEDFAESWWGNAWVAALEQGALDPGRLERGRGYAGQGHVDAITVTPGLVLAYVRGSRPRPYRVQVRLRTLDPSDWERFLDTAADRPGHIAALLDKELPQSLADCGVPLLPGPGDLDPRCSCPDRGHPCKHAAALCYQTARLLDADPFVLLLLRGRGERELLDALSRLSATRAARAAQDKEPAPLPGVRAADALAARALPPLPAPLPPPPHPEQPPAYPAAPGGPDPFALDQLATDAAARAHALLTTGRDPVGQLTLWEDAVRLAAARPGSGLTAGTRALYSSLAAAAGRTTSDLARAVAAWRQGGPEGLAVLEEPWDPPAGRFDRARPLLLAADLPAFRPWRNHLTHPHGHVQLRLGRDHLWYAYESEPGRDDWWPRGTPDLDPVGALTGLGIPGDL
ncbi:SWIM zinc finger family protein [Streptomyces venetus]|uniref:SWIM zinc finger family protein n=1 Tax=Streptomyces venetus TaxID=1701086 RepID=UPI003C2DAA84